MEGGRKEEGKEERKKEGKGKEKGKGSGRGRKRVKDMEGKEGEGKGLGLEDARQQFCSSPAPPEQPKKVSNCAASNHSLEVLSGPLTAR